MIWHCVIHGSLARYIRNFVQNSGLNEDGLRKNAIVKYIAKGKSFMTLEQARRSEVYSKCCGRIEACVWKRFMVELRSDKSVAECQMIP